ncbi:MAG: hypothetical protein EOO77_15515 [Oxalobacteraceae bacterium]|nr:MAG: hypothetical protein EOO77_15515 [Oxalobacteraceae bacterium]
MLEVGRVALQFLRHPKAPSIRIPEPPKGMTPYVMFDSDAFEVEAAVDLRGDAKGARIGWTQLQTADVNRALYKGTTPDAGRVTVFRDRSTRAMARLCRDVSFASDVFTCPSNTTKGLGYTSLRPLNLDLTSVHFPATVRVSHADKPTDGWFTEVDNDRTRRQNYLAWVLIDMQFCAVLLLKQPGGRIEQLKHFYWGLKWEARFEPIVHNGKVGGVRQVGGGANNRATFKPFVDGPVTDPQLAALIAAPTGQTCNDRAYLRNNNPEVRNFAHW